MPYRSVAPTWRNGRWVLHVLVVVGLLVSTCSFVGEAAKPHRDRQPHERSTTDRPVEVREARSGKRSRGVHGDIVGGTVVPQSKYPFAAALRIEVTPNRFSSCTGSLIDATHVLTAGHCVEEEGEVLAPAQFTVTLGRVNRLNPPPANVFAVMQVALHPGYQPSPDTTNDVAVLTLQEAVPESIGHPIAIVGASDTRFDRPGQAVTVTGWGRTVGGGTSSPDLLETELSVISDAACDAAIRDGIDDASVLCAQRPATSICQGDSGGPLFVAPAPAANDQSTEPRTSRKVSAERKRKKPKPTPPPVAPPLPPPPAVATQIGVTSFVSINCPPGKLAGFTQLSDPSVAAFIASARANEEK